MYDHFSELFVDFVIYMHSIYTGYVPKKTLYTVWSAWSAQDEMWASGTETNYHFLALTNLQLTEPIVH